MVGDKGREATIERLSVARDALLRSERAAAADRHGRCHRCAETPSAYRDGTDRLAAAVIGTATQGDGRDPTTLEFRAMELRICGHVACKIH